MKTHTSVLINLVLISAICVSIAGCEKYEVTGNSQNNELENTKSVNIEDGYNQLIWNETLVRSTGEPNKLISDFEIPNFYMYDENFKVILETGNLSDDVWTSSAIVKINGSLLFGPNDFPNVVDSLFPLDPPSHPKPPVLYSPGLDSIDIFLIDKDIKVEMELRGSPGDFMTLEIKGKMKP